jgi:hypothetical protein
MIIFHSLYKDLRQFVLFCWGKCAPCMHDACASCCCAPVVGSFGLTGLDCMLGWFSVKMWRSLWADCYPLIWTNWFSTTAEFSIRFLFFSQTPSYLLFFNNRFFLKKKSYDLEWLHCFFYGLVWFEFSFRAGYIVRKKSVQHFFYFSFLISYSCYGGFRWGLVQIFNSDLISERNF